MSIQEERFDTIEAYLNGELNPAEIEKFEKQISVDQSLKDELEKHKNANSLIVENRLLSVKNILQIEKTKGSNTSGNKPLGFIALAVVSIGIGASVILLNQKDESIAIIKETKSATERISISEKIHTEHSNNAKNEIGNNTTKVIADKSQSYDASSEQNTGFHKHQIQVIEKQLGLEEKSSSKTDSSTVTVNKQQVIKPVQIIENKSKVVATSIISPCDQVAILATIKTTPSCSDKASGIILVQSIKGGTKPYSISLSSSTNEAISNGDISKGIYNAKITDAQGCTHTYSDIVIDEKECPRDYSFNPFYGDEVWNIEPESSTGQLVIYDKGGALYFQQNIPATTVYKWSGMGNNNQILPGYYIFVIKYANGMVKKGSVTIVQ